MCALTLLGLLPAWPASILLPSTAIDTPTNLPDQPSHWLFGRNPARKRYYTASGLDTPAASRRVLSRVMSSTKIFALLLPKQDKQIFRNVHIAKLEQRKCI